eukprot:Em0010g499a
MDPKTDINIVLYGMDSTADIMYTVLSGPYCVDPTADIGVDHTWTLTAEKDTDMYVTLQAAVEWTIQLFLPVIAVVHAFHLHGLEERRVTLQADNCVGQNKNTTMMTYLAWRVITGQHDTIQLNFMLPGHTKFRPNSYFGLFKKYYRRQDHVDDMDDLADCVRQCGQDVTCVPQLYQDWHYYDWNALHAPS